MFVSRKYFFLYSLKPHDFVTHSLHSLFAWRCVFNLEADFNSKQNNFTNGSKTLSNVNC